GSRNRRTGAGATTRSSRSSTRSAKASRGRGAMSFVFELERRIIRATRALAIVGFVVLLVASLTTMLDVALRWVANAPIKGLSDFEALAVAIVIASCLPLVVAQRQNISIRFLGDALGPAASRWLDAFGALALLAFVTLIAWQLALYTAGMAESG